MPFTFKLHDPPCDVAFLSIVDGEALYTSDTARTRDVKEATIRQIGWHRILLPQEWFFSEKALETTAHVLEAMQCTVQYLKYRCKNEEKRNVKLTAALRHCEEERAAAFEELIELRENVAQYKKKLREINDGAGRGPAPCARTPPTAFSGLQCAFCENVYPSRHALESHFRKRHKRPPGYAAMAAASAAVEQKEQQQEQQVVHHEAVARGGTSDLPFMCGTSPPQALPDAAAASATPPLSSASESRGQRELREELSELRLTVAKLLAQQAEFYYGMSPSCVAAVPMPSAQVASSPAMSRAAAPRASTPVNGSGPLPGVFSPGTTDVDGGVVLRIPRELLHSSAELQLLQSALERAHRRDALASEAPAHVDEGTHGLTSPPPRALKPSTSAASRPTLDPRSFVRSSASDSVRGGTAAETGSRRRSMVDSFIEVSPMSPSPSLAQHGSRREKNKHRTEAGANLATEAAALSGQAVRASAVLHKAPASDDADDGAVVDALRATQNFESALKVFASMPERKRTGAYFPSPSSSPHALTAPSDYSSLKDDLTGSDSDRAHYVGGHSSMAGEYKAVRASADGTRTAQRAEFDSPMVRLPSSSEALTHESAATDSPSANRYAPPASEEASSQRTQAGSPSAPHGAPVTGSASGLQRHPEASLSTSLKPEFSHSLLSKKSYGPVPSVPILRASSSSDSLPPTNTRGSNASVHPSGAASAEANIRNSNGSQAASYQHGGVRSPTQTPRRASTPPTSRVAPVPALNLSSVSLHGSAELPQRSASPLVVRAQNRSGHHEATQVHASAADVVVNESLSTSSGEMASGFTRATQVPTQKTIPVVRLVPAAPSDSAELAEKVIRGHRGSETPMPSFSNVASASQPAGLGLDDAPQPKAKPAPRGDDVLQTSDASYSVEAQPFDAFDDFDVADEEEEDEDRLNAGVYNVLHSNSVGSLHEDIDVDEGDSSEPFMEDVLTDDNLAQTPILRSTITTYPAPVQQPRSDMCSQQSHPQAASDAEEEEEEEGNQRLYEAHGAVSRSYAAEERSTQHANTQHVDEAHADEKEEEVSGDYSYYSYSYSDEDKEEEEEDGDESGDEGVQGTNSSLSAPDTPPPIAVSPTAVAPAQGDDAANAAAQRDAAHTQRMQRDQIKESTTGSASPPRERHVPSAMPHALGASITGSEEMASASQTHGNLFPSNVSNTVKKAGGAFKNLFKAKKK